MLYKTLQLPGERPGRSMLDNLATNTKKLCAIFNEAKFSTYVVNKKRKPKNKLKCLQRAGKRKAKGDQTFDLFILYYHQRTHKLYLKPKVGKGAFEFDQLNYYLSAQASYRRIHSENVFHCNFFSIIYSSFFYAVTFFCIRIQKNLLCLFSHWFVLKR